MEQQQQQRAAAEMIHTPSASKLAQSGHHTSPQPSALFAAREHHHPPGGGSGRAGSLKCLLFSFSRVFGFWPPKEGRKRRRRGKDKAHPTWVGLNYEKWHPANRLARWLAGWLAGAINATCLDSRHPKIRSIWKLAFERVARDTRHTAGCKSSTHYPTDETN